MTSTDPPEPDAEWVRTSIGSATPESITVGGRDLPSEVMGHLTLPELAFLLITRREPTPGERRILDAVLVMSCPPPAACAPR